MTNITSSSETMENKELVNNIETDIEIKVNSPVDLAKTTYMEVLYEDKNKEEIEKLDFMNSWFIKLDENCTKPKKRCQFIETGGKIFLVKFKEDNLIVTKCTNFRIVDVYNAKHIFNDKSKEKDKEYIILTLVSDTGHVKENIELIGNEKNDINKFTDAINRYDNYFQISCTSREFKAFKEKFIEPKLNKNLLVYENCGIVGMQQFLGKNFFINKGHVYWANSKNLIPTTKNNFIKASDEKGIKLPELSRNNINPKIIAKDFIDNILYSWGQDSTLALLAIGHMIMGLFYEIFIGSTGVPILILEGISVCGKSTLTANGIAIFGLSEDFSWQVIQLHWVKWQWHNQLMG